MKKVLSLLAIAVFGFCQAQIVNIPDTNLKNALLSHIPVVDINDDNEIQVSEALAFTGTLDLQAKNIADATGLQAFSNIERLFLRTNNLTQLHLPGLNNLEYLTCGYNDLTSLDLTIYPALTIAQCESNNLTSINIVGMSWLENLDCGYNNINDLNLAGLSGLKSLACGPNPLGSISLTTVPALERLNCSGCQLTTLNVTVLPNLQGLGCSNNFLTTLDLSQNPDLFEIGCSYNQLTELDFSANPMMYSVQCMSNLFETLDLSTIANGNSFHEYDFKNNIHLKYLILKNGQQDNDYLDASGCPLLQYICGDPEDFAKIHTELQQQGISGVQVNSYCTFNPGGNYNTINGQISFDSAGNGCSGQPDDTALPNVKLNIADGTGSGTAFSLSDGDFTFYTPAGNFTVTPEIENPAFFTISPASTSVNFTDDMQNTETINFCISPNGTHNDVEIVMLPSGNGNAMPGFDADYMLVFKNKGNQMQSGLITVDYNENILDFVSAAPAILNQTPGMLNWTYDNLLPFESRTIYLTLNVNSPTETPPININDIIGFTATIGPLEGDDTPDDNVFKLYQTVVGSFDPNDKTCLEGNTISPDMVGNYLHYLIRFQNSGTAPAVNVVVKDMIDATKFDLASLQLIGSSHPHQTRVEGNKVEFIFENIMLPAEEDDEPGSHGFVAFKIKTKPHLVLGNTVSNTAEIFFDYNFPIVTNTATTTVSLLSSPEFAAATLSAHPNPTRNTIEVSSAVNISTIELFDIQGRSIEKFSANDTFVSLDLSHLKTGVYLAKVFTERGFETLKVIKE